MPIVRPENELFPYQEEGAEWILKKRFALLADEMGLGKSAQVIAALDRLQSGPVLILCPAVARLNWRNEFGKFSTRTLTFSLLLTARSGTPNADVTICSYDLLRDRSLFSALSSQAWDTLVLDEAHFLKGTEASRSKLVLGSGGLVHRARRTWALTGTPAPNHPAELWTLLYVFGATKLSAEEFEERFCTSRPTPYGRKITGGRNLEGLKKIMAPILLRRRKKDVMADLPKILFTEQIVEGSQIPLDKLCVYFEEYFVNWINREKGQQLFYESVETGNRRVSELLNEHGPKSPKAYEVLHAIMDGQNVLNMRRLVGLMKVQKVIEVIKAELDAGAYEKIVLFGVHRTVLEELFFGLRDYGAVLVYGGTPPAKRDANVRSFQEKPWCRVFIGQVVAAGTAITLTAAHHVAFVEADWVPANNQQAAMRVHRIGQTKPVTVRFFAMADSIDQVVQRVLKQKTRTLVELFDR